jgi:hypothetical protein
MASSGLVFQDSSDHGWGPMGPIGSRGPRGPAECLTSLLLAGSPEPDLSAVQPPELGTPYAGAEAGGAGSTPKRSNSRRPRGRGRRGRAGAQAAADAANAECSQRWRAKARHTVILSTSLPEPSIAGRRTRRLGGSCRARRAALPAIGTAPGTPGRAARSGVLCAVP